MNRRDFIASAMPAATVLMAAHGSGASASPDTPSKSGTSRRPKVLLFDVNETLLDLNAMRASVAQALGGRAELLPLWFTTMLQYSLVETVAGRYRDFGSVGVAAMMMVAANNDIALSEDDARKAVQPMRSLPPHDDVVPALKSLKSAGYRMATLTNSSQDGVNTQLRNAGLTDFFDSRLSVDSPQKFKPHADVYRWAAQEMQAAPQECMLIAAHGWDIAGALWAGMRGAFLSRPGAQLYPLAPPPQIVAPDLGAAAQKLAAL
jgi:2-haloacid dehalogenase